MNSMFKSSLNYIKWTKEAKLINITNAEWKDLSLKIKSTFELAKSNTCRTDWIGNKYKINNKGNYKYLYTHEENKGYRVYTSNFYDDKKNDGIIEDSGRIAMDLVQKSFKEQYSIGIQQAMGSTPEIFKKCVPKSFYWINDSYCNKELHHISAVDFCSHYPSSLCGIMPDSHTQIEMQGTISPTEEYPFAFYIKSGHVAEYGVFDTHKWIDSRFAYYLFKSGKTKFDFSANITPDNDITILMKASICKFDKIMQHYYDLRKIDEGAKLVMNAFIGYCHKKKYTNYRFAHIASIAIARANEKMRRLVEEEIFPQNALHICVDGLIYKGTYKLGNDEKKLNNLNQEFLDCDFKMRGMNAYIAIKDSKIVKYKHGAYDVNLDGTEINDKTVTSFASMDNWKAKESIKNDQ